MFCKGSEQVGKNKSIKLIVENLNRKEMPILSSRFKIVKISQKKYLSNMNKYEAPLYHFNLTTKVLYQV